MALEEYSVYVLIKTTSCYSSSIPHLPKQTTKLCMWYIPCLLVADKCNVSTDLVATVALV